MGFYMNAVWLALASLTAPLVSAPAHADRDIVYAVRYYTPPGSHRTSHFHLYRINPDGTGRTQLTFVNGDEEQPRWSADGRYVTFIEITGPPWLQTFCEINASGGRWRVLRQLTGSAFSNDLQTPGYRLENMEVANDQAPDQHVLVDLKTGRRLTLAVPAHDDLYDALLPMPGRDLVYAANNHNSTVGRDYLFYRLDPETRALHHLTEGQFLAWSPDGSRFCTAPGRDTTPYEKRRFPFAVRKGASAEERAEDEYRTVWNAPLYVRATSGGPLRQLTPRLSWMTGDDWRKPPKSAPRRRM